MDAAIGHLGGLDVLVNNAGIAGPDRPRRGRQARPSSTPRCRSTWPRCSTAPAAPCRRCARRAAAASSISARPPASSASRCAAPTRAAKWGVVGFTRTLAMELGPDGIRVNAILPGLVEGPRIRSVIRNKAAAAGVSDNEQTERSLSTVSLRCFVTQQDIANMALYLCSPFGATISGQAISVDGGTEFPRLTRSASRPSSTARRTGLNPARPPPANGAGPSPARRPPRPRAGRGWRAPALRSRW